MIAFLEGEVVEKAADRAVVAVGGTGYEIIAPTATLSRLPAPGRSARLYTRLQVRDDAMVLYGFSSPDERGLFDSLVTVTGVGPKVALAILSALSPDELRRAIASSDSDALTVVPGVGKKSAARLILDLKDRVGSATEPVAGGSLGEVREALLALGLTPEEARQALAPLPPNGEHPIEELLRDALRSVGR